MANSSISTKPPSGTRDFLAEVLYQRKHVVSVISEVYESFGFVPLETPAVENLTTLQGKYGDEGDQLMYKILRRRDALARALELPSPTESDLADLGLRYDLTVPLARVVANYTLPKFYKRYQIQPVWRAERAAKGRYREFYQCDVDITGTTSPLCEAEVSAAVAMVLERLGFKDFRIHLNHREILRALIGTAGIAPELEASALVAVDKLDKVGPEGVHEELRQRGIAAASAARLLDVLQTQPAGNHERLQALREVLGDAGSAALDNLQAILSLSEDTPAGPHFSIEPALARGLSYYTGAIFEIVIPDAKGSLGGGGRYDGLVGMFGKQQIPAVGFSLGLERILLLMEERAMYPALNRAADLMLCWMDVDPKVALSLAGQWRQEGLRADVYPEPAKLKKQLQYASESVGVAVAAILGGEEAAAQEVTLKHLPSGEQVRLPWSQVASQVRAWQEKTAAEGP